MAENDAIRGLNPKLADYLDQLKDATETGVEALAKFSEMSEALGNEVGLGFAAIGTSTQSANAIVSNLYAELTRIAALWVLEAKANSIEAEKNHPTIVKP